MKSVAIHSHKGGVGKSTISVNIAVELAKNHNVLIIDNDLAGPSLQTYFKREKTYINQYLSGEVEISECLHQFNHPELEGTLYYGLSDPTNKSMISLLRMDKKSATRMLKQLMNMKKTVMENYKIDYLIIDTSPGVNLTSANAFLSTDNILFINKLSNADIEGSANMIGGILEFLNNKAYMIANQIPETKIELIKDKRRLTGLIQKNLEQKIGKDIIDVIGILPMDFKLQLHEFEAAMNTMTKKQNKSDQRSGRYIYALDEPDSQFSTELREIISTIFG